MYRLLVLLGITMLASVPVLGTTLMDDPEVRRGYQEAQKKWDTDPAFKAEMQPIIRQSCDRGRANVRRGRPGLGSDGSYTKIAVDYEQGRKYIAGAGLWAASYLNKVCPDAQ